MKALILSAIIAITLVSCNQKNKETENKTTETSTNSNEIYACSMHPEITGKKGEECSKCGMELTEPVAQVEPIHEENEKTQELKDTTKLPTNDVKEKVIETKTPFSINAIVANYLKIKNALTKDDAKAAAIAGKSLFNDFNTINSNSLTTTQKKEYLDIADDAKEHAKHISDNAGKIDHQREHFATLSKDINDLIKMFGTKQKLYQDYCPMYNDGKGAIWISETKEIKNPFYGSQMLTCGSLKKLFKMKRIKKIAITFFLVFIAIQFYQPKQNVSSSFDIGKNFANNYKVPPTVLSSLQKACYDCHSNNTKYLWYDYVQPARMFVEAHINDGKKELNFNEFGSYSNRKQQSKLEAISKQIKSGEMPLSSYTLLHHDAVLTETQKQAIIQWIESINEEDNTSENY